MQMQRAAPFTNSLLQSGTGPSDGQLADLRCPILLLRVCTSPKVIATIADLEKETQSEDEVGTAGDYTQIISKINYNYPVSRPLAQQQNVQGPKWLTLASPNLYVCILSLESGQSLT